MFKIRKLKIEFTRRKKVKRFDPINGFIEIELPLEENANIEAINPMFFNFDTTKYKYGDKKSWDSCPKIFKRFATLEEIKKFCIILNQIKEDRPTTNCKIWISLENETR